MLITKAKLSLFHPEPELGTDQPQLGTDQPHLVPNGTTVPVLLTGIIISPGQAERYCEPAIQRQACDTAL